MKKPSVTHFSSYSIMFIASSAANPRRAQRCNPLISTGALNGSFYEMQPLVAQLPTESGLFVMAFFL